MKKWYYFFTLFIVASLSCVYIVYAAEPDWNFLQPDTIKPSISVQLLPEANEFGWNNSDVLVQFIAEDFETGIESSTQDVLLSDEGANQSVVGMAVDGAGNVSTLTKIVNIDKTPPQIDITGVVDGGEYTVGAIPAVGYSPIDALSGVDYSQGEYASGNVDKGDIQYSVVASDKAGNVAKKSVSFSARYKFDFLNPLVKKEKYKQGKSVPIRFSIKNAKGKKMTTANTTLNIVRFENNVEGEILETFNDVFVLKGGKYEYELDTRNMAKGDWLIKVLVDDGLFRSQPIVIK